VVLERLYWTRNWQQTEKRQQYQLSSMSILEVVRIGGWSSTWGSENSGENLMSSQ
jgi:hypothetical protein